MIFILCENGTEATGRDIAQVLQSTYNTHSPPELVMPGELWNRTPEWDDLLLVIYRSPNLSQEVQIYIQAYRDSHKVTDPITQQSRPGGFIIPVATDPVNRKPPAPISGIKSAMYDGTLSAKERIVSASGVFLGLALRPGNQRVFVSYRATDGKDIAEDLYSRLEVAGFQPWLDEAKDNLAMGEDVQEEIHEHVKSAAMVLVIDTPDAPDSDWVKEEIDTATGQLIPIVPVVVGDQVSRFITLASLRRRAPVKQRGLDRQPLSDEEWEKVRTEMEEVLLTAYQRRLRIISRAEQIFRDNGFRWSVLDEGLRMYTAERKQRPNPSTVVLSHCSVHDVTYLPTLKAYAKYIKRFPGIHSVNHKLCIYDREKILSNAEFATINDELNGDHFILAHYNELGILILSNFARLR